MLSSSYEKIQIKRQNEAISYISADNFTENKEVDTLKLLNIAEFSNCIIYAWLKTVYEWKHIMAPWLKQHGNLLKVVN